MEDEAENGAGNMGPIFRMPMFGNRPGIRHMQVPGLTESLWKGLISWFEYDAGRNQNENRIRNVEIVMEIIALGTVNTRPRCAHLPLELVPMHRFQAAWPDKIHLIVSRKSPDELMPDLSPADSRQVFVDTVNSRVTRTLSRMLMTGQGTGVIFTNALERIHPDDVNGNFLLDERFSGYGVIILTHGSTVNSRPQPLRFRLRGLVVSMPVFRRFCAPRMLPEFLGEKLPSTGCVVRVQPTAGAGNRGRLAARNRAAGPEPPPVPIIPLERLEPEVAAADAGADGEAQIPLPLVPDPEVPPVVNRFEDDVVVVPPVVNRFEDDEDDVVVVQPVVNRFEDDEDDVVVVPPVVNRFEDDVEPPVVNGLEDDEVPPVVNRFEDDVEPPVVNRFQDDVEPPVLNRFQVDVVPPVLNRFQDGVMPPLVNRFEDVVNRFENVVLPPVINRFEDVAPIERLERRVVRRYPPRIINRNMVVRMENEDEEVGDNEAMQLGHLVVDLIQEEFPQVPPPAHQGHARVIPVNIRIPPPIVVQRNENQQFEGLRRFIRRIRPTVSAIEENLPGKPPEWGYLDALDEMEEQARDRD